MQKQLRLLPTLESHAKGAGFQQYHWEQLLTNERSGSDSSEIMPMIGLHYNINTAQKVASGQTRWTIAYFQGWCPVTEHHDTAKGLLTKGIKLLWLSAVRTLLSWCTCDFNVCRLLCTMCLNNEGILFLSFIKQASGSDPDIPHSKSFTFMNNSSHYGLPKLYYGSITISLPCCCRHVKLMARGPKSGKQGNLC